MKKMKKNLAILMFITFTSAFAQEEKEFNNYKTGKNEFRIGAIHVLFLSLNANYERILDKYSGFGVTLNIYNNDSNNNDHYSGFETVNKFMLSPYYRFYFSETKEYGASGFFVEGFAAIISGEDRYYLENTFYNPNTYTTIPKFGKENFTTGALGFGIGKKWINKKGFVFEIMTGVGRGFSKTLDNEDRYIFKGDFSLGYRF